MLKQNSKKHANQECVTCIQALMVHVFSNHFFFNLWNTCIAIFFLDKWNKNFKYRVFENENTNKH